MYDFVLFNPIAQHPTHCLDTLTILSNGWLLGHYKEKK